MRNHGSTGRIATRAVVLVLALSAAPFCIGEERGSAPRERDKEAAGISMAQLRGDWTATFSGVTGCGVSTLLIEFTLDETGNGTQSLTVGHSAACGDNTYTGFPVQIQALNSDGRGFIAFGCDVGCGFGFTLQVSRNKQMFNMAAEPVIGNFLAGLAVRK